MISTRCSLKWNCLFTDIFYIKFLRHIVLQFLYLNTIFELFCGNLHRIHLIEKAHLVYNICLDRLYMKCTWHLLCWLHPFIDYSDYWRSVLDVFCHQVCHLVSKIPSDSSVFFFCVKQGVSQGLFCCDDHYLDFCWWLNTINPFILNQPCCFVPYKNLHHVRKRSYVSCPSFIAETLKGTTI